MGIISRLFGLLWPANAPAVVSEAAQTKGESLNWPVSVVDLLKALGRDSDFEARRKLAGEWGRPAYSGTEEQNIWLHAEIMKKVRSREWTLQR